MLLASFACSSVEDSDVDEAAHTEGSFVFKNDPFLWTQTSYADFVAAEPKSFESLPDTHLAAIRAQAWVDRIHAEVKKTFEKSGQILAAPKPVAKVVVSEMPGAWVTDVKVCTKAFLGPEVPLASNGTTLLSSLSSESHGFDSIHEGTCVSTPVDLNKFAKFWNASGNACSINVKGSTILLSGPNCSPSSYYALGGTMRVELAFRSTSPFIHITTKQMERMDETSLVYTLAHELGHYYRAHPTHLPGARPSFWYQDSARLDPVPAAMADELAAKYEKQAGRDTALSPAGLPKLGHYSPRLRKLLVEQLGPVITGSNNAAVTPSLRSAFASVDPRVIERTPTPAQINAYWKYEDEVHRCAQKWALSAPESPDRAGIDRFAEITSKRLRLFGKSFATLGALLAQADAMVLSGEKEEIAFLKELSENRIGMYSTEQQADEIALELATKLGFSPEELIDGVIRQSKESEAFFRTFPEAWSEYIELARYDMAQCSTLYKSGFRENGKQVYIPLGDLSDPHHSMCYRLFNLHREATKHKYITGPKLSPLSPSWDAIKKTLPKAPTK